MQEVCCLGTTLTWMPDGIAELQHGVQGCGTDSRKQTSATNKPYRPTTRTKKKVYCLQHLVCNCMTYRPRSECGCQRLRLCRWRPQSICPNHLYQGWWKSVWSWETNTETGYVNINSIAQKEEKLYHCFPFHLTIKFHKKHNFNIKFTVYSILKLNLILILKSYFIYDKAFYYSFLSFVKFFGALFYGS